MKEKLSLLISLQECDSHLVKLSAKKIKLPEKIRVMEEQFQAYRENIEQNKRKFDELKKQHTECENRIKQINTGMTKTKERMLEVKNNKEYQAMLKEIETAEKSRGDIETQVIALLDEMEKLSVLVKQDDQTLLAEKARHDEDKKSVEDDLNAVDTDTATWMQKREDLQQSIPTDLLTHYEKIRKRNGGVAVISVWKGVCSGCHMNIPPQLYNELQRSREFLSCPNCNRIMYFLNKESSN